MSTQEPGAANQDAYVVSAHAINGLGKKVKLIDEINYGYEIDSAEYQDPYRGMAKEYHTDLLRLDCKRNWTEDTLTDAVTFSKHKTAPRLTTMLNSPSTDHIEVATMDYVPTSVIPYVKHVEIGKNVICPPDWRTSNINVAFPDSSDWFGQYTSFQQGTSREALVIRGKYYTGAAGDWYTGFITVLNSGETAEQTKRNVDAYFRNFILNADHARYIIYGHKNSSLDPAGDSKTGDALFGPPENFEADQVLNFAVKTYEERFGPIVPVIGGDRLYMDHYFDLTTLFDRDEMDELQNLPSALTFDVDPSYNFYETMYENTITSGVNELFIPNMYLTLHGSYKDYPDPGLETLLTLGATAADESNFLNSSGDKSDVAKASEEYFNRFGEFFGGSGQASNDPGGVSYIKEAYRGENLGFMAKDISILKDFNEKVNKFPMAATLRFTSQKNLVLPAILEDTNYDYLLTKHTMLANTLRTTSGELRKYKQVPFRKAGQYMDKNSEEDNPQLKSYVVTRLAQMANFKTILSLFSEAGGQGGELESLFNMAGHSNHRFVGKIPDAFAPTPQPPETIHKFFITLMEKVTKSKINSLAIKKRRSYADILRGKPAYQEIIMYRVAKHIVTDGNINPVPIQNLYFCNSNNISEFIYNDTQVIYGKEYKYVIYAYTVVFGTEYVLTTPNVGNPGYTYFKNVGDNPASEFEAKAYAISRPSIQLVEVPYYGMEFDEPCSVFIYDDPPMPPNVDIGGYRGINNKILISLSNNFGSMITEPIVLEDSDNAIFNNVRAYQSLSKKLVAENKIRFESDDPSAAFQIFRIGPDPVTGTTQKPSSYGDFKGKRIKTISYPDADSASFVDRLQPNKKYYYVFRTIDVHGNISNPTVPYEVEMVSEPGSKLAYVIVRETDFLKKLKPTYKKSLKRFLHVDPREQHKYTKINSLDDIDIEAITKNPPSLGVVSDPLFVKKEHAGKERPRRFKLRLTSKKSGKKIDINIKFVHEHDKLKKA